MYNLSKFSTIAQPTHTVVSPADTIILIQEYCTSIHHGTAYIIIGGMLMWILQPAFEKFINYIDQSEDVDLKFKVGTIMFLYKWFGLGLFALSLYGIFFF